MSTDIKRAAVYLLKKTGGEITYSALKKYIYSREFVLVLMNTVDGDALLKHLNVYDRCVGNDGKSISMRKMNIVVIDDTLSVDDKIMVMLHEIYHVDHHFNDNAMDNKSQIYRETESEAFAYMVKSLNDKNGFFMRIYKWILKRRKHNKNF